MKRRGFLKALLSIPVVAALPMPIVNALAQPILGEGESLTTCADGWFRYCKRFDLNGRPHIFSTYIKAEDIHKAIGNFVVTVTDAYDIHFSMKDGTAYVQYAMLEEVPTQLSPYYETSNTNRFTGLRRVENKYKGVEPWRKA